MTELGQEPWQAEPAGVQHLSYGRNVRAGDAEHQSELERMRNPTTVEGLRRMIRGEELDTQS